MNGADKSQDFILLVDDVESARRVIKKQLEKLGYRNVREAKDVSEGLALAKLPNCCLVISDWGMPGSGGLGLLESIRGDAEKSTLPFIMITSTAEAEKIQRAASAGVTDFLQKPFSSDTLRRKIALIAEGPQRVE